ncbi:MAG: hypothetical protein GDA40_11380 [Rhodobacteraceae bacterium]|nr:hypothetical protein [Paracoccaceae bacterium]
MWHAQLAACARRLKRRALGLDLVVVDYLQLCRGTRATPARSASPAKPTSAGEAWQG